MDKKYLTEREAAEILGKQVQTLRNDRSNGRGPIYIKAGGAVRYDIDDIHLYMSENRIKPERTE